MNYNKDTYIGKEIYGMANTMVEGHEIVHVIIDVDDIGFIVKPVADLNKVWDPTLKKYVYERRNRPANEQPLMCFVHSRNNSFVFLTKDMYRMVK